MALTDFQRDVCRLIAQTRIAQGESYVAGGAALNTVTAAPRMSRDIDLFHDTNDALQASWDADRALLGANGFDVVVIRDRPTFIEARVERSSGSVLIQWARDSAYRFFPLVRHEDLGLTLHPYDLATNKVLALVGRLEVRDWVDAITCDERIQRLGYLAWGACGKDPGFNPRSILEQAKRSGRYSRAEVAELSFVDPRPDASELSLRWHRMLDEADEIAALLPADEVGKCVIDPSGALFNAPPDRLRAALNGGLIRFRPGSIRGVLPTVVS